MIKQPKTPIMSEQNECFMAFEGLVQWSLAVVNQAERIMIAKRHLSQLALLTPTERRKAMLNSQVEYHSFVIAANKVLEHRDWVLALDLLKKENFSYLEKFSREHVRDLRNMREHVVDYFRGEGRYKTWWMIETPEYKADASSVVGDMIGGRLNWVEFAAATEKLLDYLLSIPPFYPRTPALA